MAAAAAVVLAVGAVGVLRSREEPAPALAVASVVRWDRDGATHATGPATLAVGARVTAAAGERVAVDLAGGARVVVGDEDVLRVACDPREDACARAALALDAGEVWMAAAQGAPSAVGGAVLVLPDAGRLELVAGAAHVALGASAVAEVVLRDDGRLRYTPAGGVTAAEWRGPGRLRLERGAGQLDPTAAEASRFRDLEFFGGPRTRPDRRVPARAFRVLEAAAGGDVVASDGGAPARRFDLAEGRAVRLGWTLDAVAADATSARLLVRVRPKRAGPEGALLPDVIPPELEFALEGLPGAVAVWTPPTEHRGPARDAFVLAIPWPTGADRPRVGAEVTLRVSARRGDARVWFEGAAFGFGAAASGAPEGE